MTFALLPSSEYHRAKSDCARHLRDVCSRARRATPLEKQSARSDFQTGASHSQIFSEGALSVLLRLGPKGAALVYSLPQCCPVFPAHPRS